MVSNELFIRQTESQLQESGRSKASEKAFINLLRGLPLGPRSYANSP